MPCTNMRRLFALVFLACVPVVVQAFSQNGTTGSDSQHRGLRCELETPTQSHMRKEPVMSTVRFIGLDVHAATIAVAVAELGGEVRSVGVIPNRPESLRKLMKKLGPAERLRVCYE